MSTSPKIFFLKLFFGILFLDATISCCKSAEAPYNNIILQAVNLMPTGGGYGTSSVAMRHLQQSVAASNGHLIIEAQRAEPSFCSGATYLIFLKTLSLLQQRGELFLSPDLLAKLQAGNKPDGHGVWGRWNANGPGVARLFKALALGPNFTNLSEAKPGDFLKIFWSDAIGASEHGHLVVYLGQEQKNGTTYINFWSSNIPNGYGKKSVPRARAHRLIFSRLTNPQGILNAGGLPEVDLYLVSLEKFSSKNIDF